jgi:hypothetical protein
MSPMSQKQLSLPWVEGLLGKPRWNRYVHAAHGDCERALSLYEWNAQLSAALLHDISHFEIALRNSYDRALSQRATSARHWLLDPAGPVSMPVFRTKRDPKGTTRVDINKSFREQIHEAHRRVGPTATPDDIIPELPFGFWRFLTSTAHEKPSGCHSSTAPSRLVRHGG